MKWGGEEENTSPLPPPKKKIPPPPKKTYWQKLHIVLERWGGGGAHAYYQCFGVMKKGRKINYSVSPGVNNDCSLYNLIRQFNEKWKIEELPSSTGGYKYTDPLVTAHVHIAFSHLLWWIWPKCRKKLIKMSPHFDLLPNSILTLTVVNLTNMSHKADLNSQGGGHLQARGGGTP